MLTSENHPAQAQVKIVDFVGQKEIKYPEQGQCPDLGVVKERS